MTLTAPKSSTWTVTALPVFYAVAGVLRLVVHDQNRSFGYILAAVWLILAGLGVSQALTTFVEARAEGDKRVALRSVFGRHVEVDLRDGFELTGRAGPRALRQTLKVGGRKLRLVGLGTHAAVNLWLKEAQVAV